MYVNIIFEQCIFLRPALQGHVAFATVLTIFVLCQKDAGSTAWILALLACSLYLKRSIIFFCHFKVFESAHFFELMSVDWFFRLRENLLFFLLTFATFYWDNSLHCCLRVYTTKREGNGIVQQASAVKEVSTGRGGQKLYFRHSLVATQLNSHCLTRSSSDEDLHLRLCFFLKTKTKKKDGKKKKKEKKQLR